MSFESIQKNTNNVGTGEKVFNFLGKTGFSEIKKSDEKFNEWVNNLSYEDFSTYLTRLNGIIRENPTNQRSVDGQKVEISYGIHGVAFLPPYEEQKDRLMEQGFNAIKNLNNNQDRATLLYYLIQAVHPYSDGNGRTGRLIYEIFNNEKIDKDTLSTLLNHDNENKDSAVSGRDVFSKKILSPNKAYYIINREVVKTFLGQNFLDKNGCIYFSAPLGEGYLSGETENKLSLEEIELSRKILGEGDVPTFSFRGIVLAKLIQEYDSLKKYNYKSQNTVRTGKNFALEEDGGKEIFSIDDEIMNELDEKQIHRLIEIHKELKEVFIKTLIDIFENPNNHKEKDSLGKEHLLKDNFEHS